MIFAVPRSVDGVGTDYPHIVCLYPAPLGRIADDLAARTETQRKIMGSDAARLYNLPF